MRDLASVLLLGAAYAVQSVLACEIIDVIPSSVLSSDSNLVQVVGTDFTQVTDASLVEIPLPGVSIPVGWTTEGYLSIPANTLQAGKLYSVLLKDSNGDTLCSLSIPKGVFVYAQTATIVNYYLGKGTWNDMDPEILEPMPVLNSAGKEKIFILAESIFPVRVEDDVLVKFDDKTSSETISEARIVAKSGKIFVEATTPALKITKSQCPSHPDPTCIRLVEVSLSLDGGQAFSSPYNVSFAYKAPLKIGYLFRSLEDDEWSKQTNMARLELQDLFGDSLDTTFVKETVDMEEARAQMIQWCKDGIDIIMPTSSIYSSVTKSVSLLEECTDVKFAGMGTSKSRMTDTFSRAYGRTYETRYLAGMAAGFMQERTGAKCIGFIAPDPNSVVEQINAVALGCRAAYSECLVKVLFIEDFYNPSVEHDASAYLYNQEGCSILIVNTDSIEPQKYMKSVGGYSLGYNFDLRQTLGDSVLTSEIIRWLPMMVDFVRQVVDNSWANKTQLLYGLSQGGVDIDLLFSPELTGDMQLQILKKRSDIRQGREQIYSQSNMKMRWAIERQNGNLVSCKGLRTSRNYYKWKRLEEPQTISPTVFSNGAIVDDDLISADPMDGIANIGINDYFLDGIEIAQPGDSLWGSILPYTENQDGSCSYGDGMFKQNPDLPQCTSASFPLLSSTCNVETSFYSFEFSQEEDCGLEQNEAAKYISVNATPKVALDLDCSYVPKASSSGITGLIISIAGIGFNALIALLLFYYRKNPSVRLMQPNIVIFMAIGGVLLCASNLLFLGEATDGICIAQVLAFNLGFDLIFTMLVGKIYRIFKLFSEVKKLRRIVLLDKDVLMGAFALISIDTVILALWTGIPKFRPHLIEKELQFIVNLDTLTWSEKVQYYECGSDESLFKYLTLSFKAVLVIIACMFTFFSGGIPKTFLERNFIRLSGYNAALYSSIVILVTSSANPQIAFIVHCIGTALGSVSVTGLLAVPPLLVATNVWSVDSLHSSHGSESANPTFYPSKWNSSFLAAPRAESLTHTTVFSADNEDDNTASY